MPFISENRENLPILIVDSAGTIGIPLCKKLSEEGTLVFVSKKEPADTQNIIYIPFERKIPKVPDNLYSHIFVIDDGEETLDYISSFLKKAQDDKAVFCFCTSLENLEKIPNEIFEYKKSRIIFLGDLFPAGGIFSKSYVNRFLVQAKNRGRIDIPGDGMEITYSVFIDDAILGILEASFGTSIDKTYYLFPRHGSTLLTLAHMIQKSDPNIKIDFSDEKPKKTTPVQKEGKYLLSDNYNIEEKIKDLKIRAGQFTRKESVEELPQNTGWTFPSFLNPRILLFSVIFFLFLPLLTTLIFSFLAGLSLDKAKSQSGNSKYFLGLSKSSFALASSFSKVLLYETSFLKPEPITKLTQSIEDGNLQTENILEYFNALDLLHAGKTAEGIASLKNFLVFTQSKKLNIIDGDLLNFISQTINVWPQILAVDSNKTYLILFQNNFFPRPTGGIIQSYGILSLENGKISDFKIYNTYDSDKNLKGHVEPPFAVRRYLKSPHWYLRDSNFNPDFIESAASSSFFVDLENNQKVDGVIAVDVNFLIKLFEKKGQVLDKEKLNHKNYLTEVATKLKDDLKLQNLAEIFLSKDFAKQVEKKDIIFAFKDKSIENIFSTNNFSSTIYDNRQNSPKRINDYLGIVEVNLGDSQESIERKLTQKIDVSEDGNVLSNVSYEIKNSAKSDYNNYLRFVVPQGSLLQKVKINGENREFTDAETNPSVYESKDFTPPQKLEVEKYNQNGKSVSGFYISVPQGERMVIDVSYNIQTLPSISTLSDFSYNLHFFKQPGIDPYPFKTSISYPSYFKTSSITSFQGNTDRDFELGFNFTH